MPVGCLGSLVVFVGGIVLFVFLVYSGVTTLIRSSDPFQEAMSRAQAHPDVQAALGTPLEPGFWLSGSIKTSGSSGNADISIPVSGPKGSGTIYVVGTKSAGAWRYTAMEVEIPGRPNRINLLTR
ncbi:MAG: cytochrome c oxidase assembly factor 1 family protein [Chloroflexota bacterium]